MGKTENHIGYQIRKPKTKCKKTENPQTAMNTKLEKPKYFCAKTEKPLLKKSKPFTTENPNTPVQNLNGE